VPVFKKCTERINEWGIAGGSTGLDE